MATVLVSAGMWLCPDLPAKKGGNLVTAESANAKKERRTGHQCLELTLASVSGFVEGLSVVL